MKSSTSFHSGQQAFRWVVLLLLIAVVLPTVCLLWFMTQAVRNERLAMRQKLVEEYSRFLNDQQETFHETWTRMLSTGSSPAPLSAAGMFAFLLNPEQDSPASHGPISGALIFNDQDRLCYPLPPDLETVQLPDRPLPFTEPWNLEFGAKDLKAAARAYQDIASDNPDSNVQLRASLAAVRCWRKQQAWNQAIALSEKILQAHPPDQWPLDMLSYVQFRVQWLTLLDKVHDPRFLPQLQAALTDATDYQGPLRRLSSSQRQRFQQDLLPLAPALAKPTLTRALDRCRHLLTVETFSRQCSRQYQSLPSLDQWPAFLLKPLFQEQSTLGVRINVGRWTALLLLRAEDLTYVLKNCLGTPIPGGLSAQVVAADGTAALPAPHAEGQPLVKGPLSPDLPGWTLEFHLDNESVFALAAQRQMALYWWIGLLVSSVVIALALVVVRAVGQQVRLNRLKNDFIATVTHELKTPLASMRLLLDTLLEGRTRNAQQVTDYLQLMSRENHRLAGLIDNFLTFSRMERNKQSFSPQRTDPAQLARDAGAALETRFSQGSCHFALELAPDLPEVWADPDAWITVLVNLLDNAYKYSGDVKQIRLRVTADEKCVRFSVTDNGIGIPRRACRHIFDKFYQVDRSLSRRAEGCGLGLSIVKFIIAAHQGRITVESQVGSGSTFTVTLPVYRSDNA